MTQNNRKTFEIKLLDSYLEISENVDEIEVKEIENEWRSEGGRNGRGAK